MSVWEETGQFQSSENTANYIQNCEVVVGQQMSITESVDAEVLI